MWPFTKKQMPPPLPDRVRDFVDAVRPPAQGFSLKEMRERFTGAARAEKPARPATLHARMPAAPRTIGEIVDLRVRDWRRRQGLPP